MFSTCKQYGLHVFAIDWNKLLLHAFDYNITWGRHITYIVINYDF